MKYAIISDIHGNLPALKAALSDAEAHGATKYLFLGDYYMTFPWVNEVAEILRGLDSAVIIRGNNEDYLIGLMQQKQIEYDREQFKPLYWNYRSLTPKNLEYLTTLPETATISENSFDIHLAHSLNIFFRVPKVKPFHSSSFRVLMEKKPFTHDEYLVFAREALLSRSDALEDILALSEGVYLFGHNHLQFHMEYEGRLFVNPGSCGVACDFDPTAAYTLLERMGNGWSVDERRVKYDIDATAIGLRNSSLTTEAPIWSRIIERQLKSGKDYFGLFVSHLADTGRKFGENEMPVSNHVWNAAVQTWDANKI